MPSGVVERFAANPQAAHYLNRYYDPRGRLPFTEILQLHTTRDPIVSLDRHQPVYEELLLQTGNLERYFVRTADRFGHCAFSNQEILESFDDLVHWSRTGLTPEN